MPWVRIDENFPHHPKVMAVGPLGLAMQVAGLCYCNRYLTDGFIPKAAVPTLLNFDGLAMRVWHGELVGGGDDASWELVVEDLLRAGLWEEVEGGYRIHDYLDYQPSRARVLAEKQAARERMANVRGRSKEVQANSGRNSGELRMKFDFPDPNPVPVPQDRKTSCPDSASPDTPPTNPDGQPSACPQFDEAAPAYKAALYLRTRILQHNPRTPVPRADPGDRQMQRWALEMDRLNRLGPAGGDKAPYSWDEIKRIVDWIFDVSDFWAPNIRSPAKLRAQITTLEGQMRRARNQRAPNFDVHYAGKDEAWYEQFEESAAKHRARSTAGNGDGSRPEGGRGPP